MIKLHPALRYILTTVLIISGLLLAVHYMGGNKWEENHKLPPAIIGHDDKLSTITGTVSTFIPNDLGDVDRLSLKTASGIHFLFFPPHTANTVMAAAPIGKNITVGVSSKEDRSEIRLLTTDAGIIDIHRIKPPLPVKGKPVTIQSAASTVQKQYSGHFSGLLIKNYLVLLPQHKATQLEHLLKGAKSMQIKGYLRSAGEGFVNQSKYIVVRPYAIEIDGTSYLL